MARSGMMVRAVFSKNHQLPLIRGVERLTPRHRSAFFTTGAHATGSALTRLIHTYFIQPSSASDQTTTIL